MRSPSSRASWITPISIRVALDLRACDACLAVDGIQVEHTSGRQRDLEFRVILIHFSDEIRLLINRQRQEAIVVVCTRRVKSLRDGKPF